MIRQKRHLIFSNTLYVHRYVYINDMYDCNTDLKSIAPLNKSKILAASGIHCHNNAALWSIDGVEILSPIAKNILLVYTMHYSFALGTQKDTNFMQTAA